MADLHGWIIGVWIQHPGERMMADPSFDLGMQRARASGP